MTTHKLGDRVKLPYGGLGEIVSISTLGLAMVKLVRKDGKLSSYTVVINLNMEGK